MKTNKQMGLSKMKGSKRQVKCFGVFLFFIFLFLYLEILLPPEKFNLPFSVVPKVYALQKKPAPKMAVSPCELNFVIEEFGKDPKPQIIKIMNTQKNSTLRWEVQEATYWIETKPKKKRIKKARKGRPGKVKVYVKFAKRKYLNHPYYSGYIVIRGHYPASPAVQYVRVNVSIPKPPRMGISCDSLTFKTKYWGVDPKPQYVEVKNLGTGDFTWTAYTSYGWLKIYPKRGRPGDRIKVWTTVNWDWSQKRIYSGNIIIQAKQFYVYDKIKYLPVTFDNNPKDVLYIKPRNIIFLAETYRGRVARQVQTIFINSINYWDRYRWRVEYDPRWIEVEPTEGTTPGKLTVRLKPDWDPRDLSTSNMTLIKIYPVKKTEKGVITVENQHDVKVTLDFTYYKFKISGIQYPFPNPFDQKVYIKFSLLENAKDVVFKVYNLAAELIYKKDFGPLNSGSYEEISDTGPSLNRKNAAIWHGINFENEKVLNGIYLYVIEANFKHETQAVAGKVCFIGNPVK